MAPLKKCSELSENDPRITSPILHAEKLIFERRHQSIAENRYAQLLF